MKNTSKIYDIVEKIREQKPVVHHLTNWVTIYDCANIVKVLGGSPIMAHAPEEIFEITSIASSLVLNIGTLTVDFVESTKIAAKTANLKKIPVVLDVCGAGASRLRNQKVSELIEYASINIIKGNGSEIASIAGENVFTKGVDSTETGLNLIKVAEKLAVEKQCIVAITGKQDIVSDGKRTFMVKNGHELLSHIVGTGCMATSVIGTFAAVEKDLVVAATGALALFGIAAEVAAESTNLPSSFKTKLFDVLYSIDRQTIEKR
ncbi:MAG: hydroxyethylthiazole kinase, partial [Candidatus Omnitrophica bacterium]|nr:hydroxyethylthiazole kinase [Candidatus Omnitrophota bacterium]